MNESEKRLLDEIVQRIMKVAHPRKIILFGSYARGEAGLASDLDILVIVDSAEPRYRRSAPLYGILSDILVPMDIMVYTPDEVEEWSDVRQAFITAAVREGKVLYEDKG